MQDQVELDALTAFLIWLYQMLLDMLFGNPPQQLIQKNKLKVRFFFD